jgi:hypothetical protein
MARLSGSRGNSSHQRPLLGPFSVKTMADFFAEKDIFHMKNCCSSSFKKFAIVLKAQDCKTRIL